MSDFGGRADKFGGFFERNWVVHLAIRVLNEDYLTVRWEPVELEGVDTSVQLPDGTREVHQCKRKNAAVGKWSIRKLSNEGVLRAAKRHLEAGASRFVFVSQDPAPELQDLIDRARTSNGDAEILAGDLRPELKRAFAEVQEAWSSNAAVALQLLARLRILKGFDREDTGQDEMMVGLLADGVGSQIHRALASFLEERLGNDTGVSELRNALTRAGHPPKDAGADPRVAPAVDKAAQRFCQDLEETLVLGQFIGRPEVAKCVDALTRDPGPRLVIVHGNGGIGKSAVLFDTVNQLRAAGSTVLPIRLDELALKGAVGGTPGQIGLPRSPSACLNGIARGAASVLILDQVDSVRWTSSQSSVAWSACREMIEEALATDRQRVVLACRTFDFKSDELLKGLVERAKRRHILVEEVPVGPLESQKVAEVVEKCGAVWASLDKRAQDLLRDPFNLRTWTLLRKAGRVDVPLSSRASLLREYWSVRRRELAALPGVQGADLDDLLRSLVAEMQERRSLFVPRTSLVRWEHILPHLLSLGVLSASAASSGRVSFVHQSHRDFLIAELVARDANSEPSRIAEWVRAHQALFDRDQIRQLLFLERDDDPRVFVQVVRSLLTGAFRFHVKQIAMGVLASVSEPTKEECALLASLSENPDLRWALWRGIVCPAMSVAYFEALVHGGQVSAGLVSTDNALVGDTQRLCYVMAPRAPIGVELAIRRAFPDANPPMETLALCLGREPSTDTDQMFSWRLSLLAAGRIEGEVLLWDKDLMARFPVRTLRALRTILVDYVRPTSERTVRSRLDQALETFRDSHLVGQLIDLSSRQPKVALRVLLPAYERHLKRLRRLARRRKSGTWDERRRLGRVTVLLRKLLVAATQAVVQQRGPRFCSRLIERFVRRLGSHENALVARVLLGAPHSAAEWAGEWLLEAPARRLDLGSTRGGRRRGMTSARVLWRFSPHFSDEKFHRIEAEILRFHSASERRMLRQRRRDIRGGRMPLGPNSYGLSQNLLLAALPRQRLSQEGVRALLHWRVKFGRPRRHQPLFRGGTIRSPLPPDVPTRISDAHWIRLAAADWSQWKNRRAAHGADWLVERSHQAIASDFGTEANKNPERFGRILLRTPVDVPDCYLSAGLLALGLTAAPDKTPHPELWSPCTVATIERVIERYAGRIASSADLAMRFARLIEHRSDETWSSDVVAILDSLARNHPDPEAGRFAVSRQPPGQPEVAADIVSSSYNCVRGCAAEALGHFLWRHPEQIAAHQVAIAAATSDPHPAVRVGAQILAAAVYRTDQPAGLALFLQCCAHPNDGVLEGPQLRRHLSYLWNFRAEELSGLFSRMAASSIESVAEAGAYWLTASSVLRGIPGLGGPRATPSCRRGQANFWAHIAIREPARRDLALEQLTPLLADTDEAVVRAAAQPLLDKDFRTAAQAPLFAEAFVLSPALELLGSEILEELSTDDSVRPFAGAVLGAARRVGADLRSVVTSPGSPAWFIGDPLSKLLFRLYEEMDPSTEPELHERCLDAIDAVLESEAWGGADLLAQVDG